MGNKSITALPANTGLANDTLFEDVKDPSGLTLSQKVRLDDLTTWVAAHLGDAQAHSFLVNGGNISLNADGSAHFILGANFASGSISLNPDGSASLASGNFSIDNSGNVTGSNLTIGNIAASGTLSGVSLNVSGVAIVLSADGSANFAANNAGFDSAGNLFCQEGSFLTGAQFGGSNQFQIDGSGNVTVNGGVASLNSSSGGATFASGSIILDGSTGAIICQGATINGAVAGLYTMSLVTSSPATFNSVGRNETIYDTSGSVLSNLTIVLPTSTVAGQILRYVSKAGATLVTVTGTVSIGAAVTTLAANASVAWQAVDGSGMFIRIQ